MTEHIDDMVNILPPTVGEQLKSAREAKKYTIAEVAAQLRLTRETVRYLETGNWDELHGRAYARGYFVSYVNFLGLDQDELLTEFNAQYKRHASPVNIASPRQTSEGRHYPLLPLVVLIIVLLLLWFAFQQRQSIGDGLEELLRSQVGSIKNPDSTFSNSIVQQLIDTENEQYNIASDKADKRATE